MDNFFKQFRENLDSRPESDFKEQDWSDMEKRLEGRRRRAVGAVWWWWLGVPVLALSLLSNAMFFNTLEKANFKIAVLQSSPDTVFLTKVEYRTDTVYRTKTVWQTVVKYLPAAVATAGGSAASPASQPTAHLPIGEKNLAKSMLHDGPASGLPVSSGDAQAQGAWTEKGAETGALPPLPVAAEPLHASLNKTLLPWAEAPPIERARKRKFWQQVQIPRPTDFQVGANIGLAFPISEGLRRQSGRSLGLQGSAVLSPRLRLWVEADWLSIGFRSDRMDEGIGIPPVAAPADDFQFIKAETYQPMLQYAAGFQYLLNPNGRWKPSVGLGYGAVSVFPYEVAYEFYNPALGTEWSIDKSVQINELMPNFLHLSAGVERRLSQHWHWQIGLVYRTHFEDKGLASPQIFGVQSGLKFGF